MMPKGASKGTALSDLCSLLGVPIGNTYAIGDYYNDIEMMKYAGHAVAVDNAPDEVKAVANEIADSNDNGGVGQFLYRLIQKYG
jgi:hydroxymethylpyrimidine pyrophosphatase-like HAD family hydrolase